jgi:MFS transporter, DHA2 family, multidrug resistance protein
MGSASRASVVIERRSSVCGDGSRSLLPDRVVTSDMTSNTSEPESTVDTAGLRAKAGRREWIGLLVIALPCLVYAMDLTVLNLALPSLSADLRPSSTEQLWIVDIYGFLVAGLLITMGTLGDRIGRRRLLLIGAAAFGVASVLAAFAYSAESLIVARALLGVAGATLAPSTLSLIRNMFHDAQQRTVAIGVWITSFSAGAAIGPLVGGVLLERFWWGSVFLPAVPVMALLLVVGPRLLPEYRPSEAGRLDLTSAAVSLVAVLAVIYGLKQIAQDGAGPVPALVIVGGLAVGAAFVRRQRHLADPLLDLRLFRVPAFNAALAVNTLGFFVNFGAAVFIAQYLQLVLGLSPLEAGLWSVPGAVGFIVGSLLTPVIVRRIRPAVAMAGGLALAAAGFGLLTRVDGDAALGILVTGSVVFALGLAPVFTLAADMMVGAAPPERAGAAAGVSETSSEFGGALGIAVLGTIGTAVYRSHVATALPAGVPPGPAEAARDTLGGAVAVGHDLPDPLGVDLLDAARDAFTQGLRVAATVSAVIAIAAAAIAAAVLTRRRVAVSQAGEDQTESDRAVGECALC